MNKEKKQKNKPSLAGELLWGIIDLLLGDASTKISMALLFLIIGILCFVVRVVNQDGMEIKNDIGIYIMGSFFLLLSVILIISWIRKRTKK